MSPKNFTPICVEPTADGLFMAYFSRRVSCYALGETEGEARENLLDRFDFNPEDWSDYDEYCFLAGSIL